MEVITTTNRVDGQHSKERVNVSEENENQFLTKILQKNITLNKIFKNLLITHKDVLQTFILSK